MQIFRKLAPLLPNQLLAPCPSGGSKNFLGGFWSLSQLKFEETSPKIPRMQILRKLAPLAPLLLAPLAPLGSQSTTKTQKHLWAPLGMV